MRPARHRVPATRQHGLSLVELMVSLTIGLIITAAIGYLYTNSRQTYRQQDSLARIQENGRFALDAIGQDVRNAGYWGCATRGLNQPISTLNTPTGYARRYNQFIVGHEATGTTTWVPVLDASITAPLGGADVLTLRGALGTQYDVTAHTSPTAPITVSGGGDLSVGDVAIASDCEQATVFEVSAIAGGVIGHTAVGGATGNSTANLGKTYLRGNVTEAFSRTYYLRYNPAGRPALYRLTNGTAEELVENVEGMQITYGRDTNNDGALDGNYVTANNVADWTQVRTVRIRLLLVTPDNHVSGAAQVYRWDSDNDGNLDSVTAPDRRLRYVYTSTVTLRNRLP